MAQLGVVVVAAGRGTRLGGTEPKAFVELNGKTLLQRALEPLFELEEPVEIVVVVASDRAEHAQEIVRRVAGVAGEHVRVVEGGAERHWSVANGLAALSDQVEVVLVHDAARALTPAALFRSVAAEVRRTGDGVVPGLPVADTIKRVDDGLAIETVDRSELAAVQTPQGFPLRKLLDAYRAGGAEQTDDAAVYSAAGHRVHMIGGDALAFKITTAWDLRRASALLGEMASTGLVAQSRTGIGIDVHAYDATRPLWLGGIHWPDEVGLAGHSDGDALAHAICDALLSAAGLGDIGGRFGTADPAFAGAHGDVFVRATVTLVRGAGYDIQNVAVQVVGQTPRMAPRRAEVERLLTALVGAPVSVSATTSDGLGFTGRGQGIAAIATALLTTSTA